MRARSYWSLSCRRPAEQGCDKRPAIVIYPDDSGLKTGRKSLLFAITKQPEDALVLIHKYNTLTLNNYPSHTKS